MKTISPVQSWNNGQAVEAIYLNGYVISDNLISSASFYYCIQDETFATVAQGNLTMTGEDYTAYQTNQYAWDWIASSLKLTITGDYVPPVVEAPIEPIETPTEEIITE